jgi:hypothetical protein
MINKYVAMGLGALIALAPVAALAQEQVAQAATDTTAPSMAAKTTGHTGSHRGHQRRKGNTSAHRARASAHHVHAMHKAPAEAPKS